MQTKSALVTGSSSGIGLLTAVELGRAGFRVVATMREPGRRERLDRAAAEAGVRLDVRRLDVTEFAAMRPLVEQVVAEYGRLDVLVNNAGFATGGFAEDMRLEEIRRQLETNFYGQVAMTQAALPQMRRQGGGHIIMVSSISGRLGQPGLSTYAASKFALEGWSEALRLEARGLGIRVVLVEPGGFATDIWTRNAVLGEGALSEKSPNRERGMRLREWAERRPKHDARVVARLIARIAQHPNPRLRYLAGRDARLHALVRSLLPWRVYERLVCRSLGI